MDYLNSYKNTLGVFKTEDPNVFIDFIPTREVLSGPGRK